MKDKKYLRNSTLSLQDIENTNSEILQRIADDMEVSDGLNMSHTSHSSSSGRGHSSHVSGSAAKSDKRREQ